MKYMIALLVCFTGLNAWAGGSSPARIHEPTYKHFLDQAREVLALQGKEGAEFDRHWNGLVNRANTEWRDVLLACGYDPAELYQTLPIGDLKAQQGLSQGHPICPYVMDLAHQYSQCIDSANKSRESDRDWCGKNQKDAIDKCLDRADSNFNKVMGYCTIDRSMAMIERVRNVPERPSACEKGGACEK